MCNLHWCYTFCTELHFLHWCYTWTALLSANQNRVIFFMYIIIIIIIIIIIVLFSSLSL